MRISWRGLVSLLTVLTRRLISLPTRAEKLELLDEVTTALKNFPKQPRRPLEPGEYRQLWLEVLTRDASGASLANACKIFKCKLVARRRIDAGWHAAGNP